MANTTANNASKAVSKSRSSRPATSGNKNVRATRSPKAMGNATLGATLPAVRKVVKGPFLGTNKPSA